MDRTAWTLRVTAPSRDSVRVSTRRHQFVAGRPMEFDPEAAAVSAIEYALGAVGAEIVAGLRAFAKRRRLPLDEVEALVEGEVAHVLAYLGVVGETERPRITRVAVKVYVATAADPDTVRRTFAEATAMLPLLGTLRAATRVDVRLILTT